MAVDSVKYRSGKTTIVAIAFDLFGTLVTVDRPDDPTTAVARELRAREISVPEDWAAAYRRAHVESQPGEELALPEHVLAALRSRNVTPPPPVVREAILSAFDSPVQVCEGTREAVHAATTRGPVGLCSNCSVPGLVERTIERSGLENAFDAVVTSVGCGWRKPDRRAFEAVGRELGVPTSEITHVGDDPATDGGIEAAGGRFIDVRTTSLPDLADRWRDPP